MKTLGSVLMSRSHRKAVPAGELLVQKGSWVHVVFRV